MMWYLWRWENLDQLNGY